MAYYDADRAFYAREQKAEELLELLGKGLLRRLNQLRKWYYPWVEAHELLYGGGVQFDDPPRVIGASCAECSINCRFRAAKNASGFCPGALLPEMRKAFRTKVREEIERRISSAVISRMHCLCERGVVSHDTAMKWVRCVIDADAERLILDPLREIAGKWAL